MGLIADLIIDSIQRSRRDAAREAAMSGAFQQGLRSAGVSDPADLALLAAPNVRGIDPSSARAQAAAQAAQADLAQSLALADAGVDEHKLAQARDEQARTRNFLDVAAELAAARRSGRPVSGWDVISGNFANKLKLDTPADVQGDTVFNRYDPAAPLATTPLGQAKIGSEQAQRDAYGASARLHDAQAEQAAARLQAIRNLPPETDPLLRADAYAGKDVFKPERVKVRRADGSEVYMDAIPSASGGFTYRPAQDSAGAPLLVPPSASAGGEDLYARRAGYIARTLQIPEASALQMLLTTREDSPATAWAKAGRLAAQADFGLHARDPARLRAKTEEIFGVMYPELAAPTQGAEAPPPSAAPAPAAPPAAAGAAMPANAAAPTLLTQARAAIARGAPRAAVEDRLRRMGVDPAGL